MKKIKLTQGKFALVSDIDYTYLNQWKWCVAGYAKRHGQNNKLYIYMHKVILRRMGYYRCNRGDHINGNKLDNRRSKLRPATDLQNRRNQYKYKNNTSGYKGVYWLKTNKKWMAQIKITGRAKYLGSFVNKKEAAKAYNKAAKKHFGKFARLNKV